METVRDLLPIVQIVNLCLVPLAGWIIWSARKTFLTRDDADRRDQSTTKAIKAESIERQELERRLAKVESTVSQLPDLKGWHDLSIQLTAIQGELKVLNQKIEGFDALQDELRHQVRVMDDFLRKVKS